MASVVGDCRYRRRCMCGLPVNELISTSLADWREWLEAGFERLPVVTRLNRSRVPESWMDLNPGSIAVILESGGKGQWSYFCDQPERLAIGTENQAKVWVENATRRDDNLAGKPMDVTRAFLAGRRVAPLSLGKAMAGGAFVLFGYDLARTWERLPTPVRQSDLCLPLYVLIEPRELYVFDHRTENLTVITWRNVECRPGWDLETCFEEAANACIAAVERWRTTAGQQLVRTQKRAPSPSASSMSPEQFRAAAAAAKSYIAAGDSYQVNLSLRRSRPTRASAGEIFEAVRRINPSPYMGVFKTPEFTLVCGSPELLVSLSDGKMEARPIAGTRQRGADAAQDAQLGAELMANEKERAEHLMLVDLIRNDLGRVASFGSVSVPEFMITERYSHVMHLVSQVEAELAAGCDWQDVIESLFPGGTITGCPKIRTMEIIDELEPVSRGFYTGALGWISYEGNLSLNIVIRSILLHRGLAHIQAGAGIVADSDPEREYDECERKAAALWQALEHSENAYDR